MTEETCINCKHWRPTIEQDGIPYGECHGGPPLQLQPPAIGRIPRLAAWILTPGDESCGGFAPQPRAADPFEDTLEGAAPAETPSTDVQPPQSGRKGKANAKA